MEVMMAHQTEITSPTIDSHAVQSLADRVIACVPDILRENGKAMDAEQMEKLATHMRAMARRSLTGEALPDFDTSLFDDVSDRAVSTARQIVAIFHNLPEEEALLLSIHFEMAQDI